MAYHLNENLTHYSKESFQLYDNINTIFNQKLHDTHGSLLIMNWIKNLLDERKQYYSTNMKNTSVNQLQRAQDSQFTEIITNEWTANGVSINANPKVCA